LQRPDFYKYHNHIRIKKMPIANGLTNIFRLNLMNGGFLFEGPVSPLITIANGSTTPNSVSSMVGVTPGMFVSGTGIANGTTIASANTTNFTLSLPVTANITATSVNITGHTFYMALITANAVGTYSAATSNYSQLVANGDEVSGTGYVAGGTVLVNQSAALSGNVAMFNFASSPAWGVSTFSYSGAMLYDACPSVSGVSGVAVALWNFGNQTVSGTTLTLTLPAFTATTALITVS
jgi:hypothetical protein